MLKYSEKSYLYDESQSSCVTPPRVRRREWDSNSLSSLPTLILGSSPP